MNFYTSSQERVKLYDTPLGRGGEGNVFEVVSPLSYKGYVAKIYHPKERRKERELKLIYILSHRPRFEDQLSVIWPEEILYENDVFVGFLMRKANSAIDLTSLCSLRIPTRLGNIWKRKFDRNTAFGLQNRIKVCKNIAAALVQMHQTGNYVLVDIKPENIKVNLKAQVSIIDIDSIEVVNHQRLIFPAEKTSMEYSPAEIKKMNIKQDLVEDTWDRFSMAIVFYKVLFGLHPFTGTCKPPYDKLVSNEDKIAEGLFPMGEQKKHFQVIPQPHKAFYSIAASVQRLFIRCFGEGHASPSARPSAEEWLQTFQKSPRFDPIDRHYKPKEASVLHKKLRLVRSNTSLPALLKSTALAAILVGATTLGVIQLSSFKLPENFLANPNIDHETAMMQKAKRNKMYIGHFKEGVAKAKKNGKYAFIQEKGDNLTRYKYDWADNYYEGTARAAINNKYGFVDKKGKEIIPIQYDWVGKFSEGLAKVEQNGKMGFINQQNQLIIPLQFDYSGDFKNGFAVVRVGEKWGVINRMGQQVIAPKYDLVKNFHQGRALVLDGNKVGYIDQHGQEIIKPQYYYGTSFVEGKAIVYDFKRRKMNINLLGQIVAIQ